MAVTENSVRSLLALSCYYPPLLSPRSIQVQRTIAHLPAIGWNATVLCGKPDTLWGNRDPGLAQIYPAIRERIEVSADPLLKKWYGRLLRLCPFAGQVPDPYLPWSLRAARIARRRLKPGDFDAIATFGNPMSVHLAGAILKRAWRKPWIAHFSDPWVDNPYSDRRFLSDAIQRRLEAYVIGHADTVVFTSEYTSELTMKKYRSSWQQKAVVIPHCFDGDLYPQVRPRNERLLFRSIGNFYGPRTPRPLLEALVHLRQTHPEILDNYFFEFIGNCPADSSKILEEYDLTSVVAFRGSVGYLESLVLMKTADVLLLIDAPMDVNLFLPSKLIDYLGSGNTILGITPQVGASADVIRSVGGMVVSPEDVKGITQAIFSLHWRWLAGKLQGGSCDSNAVQPFTIGATLNQWREILENLIRISVSR